MSLHLRKITLDEIINSLGNPSDLTIRSVTISLYKNIKLDGSIIYISGIVNEDIIEDSIIKPILESGKSITQDNLLPILKKEILQVKSVSSTDSLEKTIEELVNGKTVIYFSNLEEMIIADTSMWKERSVSEAQTQRVAKGPVIGFNESLNTNIALMRKSIKSSKLRLEKYTYGSLTNTEICVMYIDDLVDKEVLKELKNRLKKIKLTKLLDANYIEEFISDDFTTPFPLVLTTDRPDVVTGEITDGRIAILIEGTPYALIVPALFIQFLHSADDYYFINGGITRFFRMFSMTLAIYIPALYVAFVNFNPGLLPVDLLISLASQREGKPFPLVIEILLFMFLFQMIIEGAIRLQKGLVSVVSIVGTIIIGQSAVEAGLAQPATLLVVSISYIFSFVSPIITLSTAVRTIRYGLIFVAAFFGLYGIVLATITLIFHLSHLRSFGIPYLSPLFPFNLVDQKDAVYRASIKKLTRSKHIFHHEESVSQKDDKE